MADKDGRRSGQDRRKKDTGNPKGKDRRKGGRRQSDKKDKGDYRDYGFVKSFLADHPAVKRLVKKAVKEQWTPQRFQGALKETNFWRNLSAQQRKATLLENEQPEEYARQLDLMGQQIGQLSEQMGLSLDPAQAKAYARTAFRNGYSAQEITEYLARRGDFDVEDAEGAAAVTVDGLRSMAASFGLRLSSPTLVSQVRAALATGNPQQYLDGYVDRLREQAKVLFPGITNYLDNGGTVKDYLSPYLEMAGQELGIDPNALDITDPKWTKVINGGPDGTPMNQDQWMATVRSDERYGWAKTSNAKNQAADFANQMLALMRGGIGA